MLLHWPQTMSVQMSPMCEGEVCRLLGFARGRIQQGPSRGALACSGTRVGRELRLMEFDSSDIDCSGHACSLFARDVPLPSSSRKGGAMYAANSHGAGLSKSM